MECCVMNSVHHLREDLAFVDRMLAECRYHISQLQKTTAQKTTAEKSDDAQDTDIAYDVLACFTAALTRYEAERERVVSAIASSKSSADPDRSRPPASIPRREALKV